ncbi:MAG: FAD-binding oxidoreductase [bacterium]
MQVKREKDSIANYLEDASNLPGGWAKEVFLPENTLEASQILRQANQKKTPVTVSGGGTGTAGGRIPFGGVVLSTEKLKGIKIENGSGKSYAEVGAGVLIQDLKQKALEKKLFYPYDPTEQTAFVGGTIATNASGARSLKYGSTRQFVQSLEVVLADGNIVHIRRGEHKAKGFKFNVKLGDTQYMIPVPTYKMPAVRKHSAGYFAQENMDLVDLFVGQEGTLGLLASAKLSLVKEPFDIFSCFAFFIDEPKSWEFAARAADAGCLSVEYLDINALNLMRDTYSNIPPGAKSCVFFEVEMEKSKEEDVLSFWDKMLSEYGVNIENTWVAMTEQERKEFQQKRHSIPEKINDFVRAHSMPKVSTDLAVPRERLSEMMRYYKQILPATGLEHFIFGHIGDAHLHTNLLPETEQELVTAKEAAEKLIRKSIELGGTVSAEHGIGKMKRQYLLMLYGEDGIKQMAEVKRSLDPNFILNRGDIIDEEYLR